MRRLKVDRRNAIHLIALSKRGTASGLKRLNNQGIIVNNPEQT